MIDTVAYVLNDMSPVDEAAVRAYRLGRLRGQMAAADVAAIVLFDPVNARYGAYNGQFEENMVVCIESYVGTQGGHEGVRLEQPVWLTDEGPVCLSDYPLEDNYA